MVWQRWTHETGESSSSRDLCVDCTTSQELHINILVHHSRSLRWPVIWRRTDLGLYQFDWRVLCHRF